MKIARIFCNCSLLSAYYSLLIVPSTANTLRPEKLGKSGSFSQHTTVRGGPHHGGIIMERTRGVSLRYSGGGDPLCTLHREEVLYGGLGSLQRIYERFPIEKEAGRHQPHRRDCTAEGPSSVLYGWECVRVCESVWECVRVSENVWECVRVCESVRECVIVCECVWECVRVYEGVWVCESV